MKKNDYILVFGVIMSALALFLVTGYFRSTKGTNVEITVNGNHLGTYSLMEEQEIKIHDTNVLRIKDGKADMIHASCPDQYCVKQDVISKAGETLVCLPNKVIVTVIGNDKKQDVIVK